MYNMCMKHENRVTLSQGATVRHKVVARLQTHLKKVIATRLLQPLLQGCSRFNSTVVNCLHTQRC